MQRTDSRRDSGIPDTLLIAACSFGEGLNAEQVAAAIAGGVKAAKHPEPDLLPLPRNTHGAAGTPPTTGALARALAEAQFDQRMRLARAVIVAEGRLQRDGLQSGATFEIATRARQAGVPAYAVTAENLLDEFDARMLDLQVILEARGARGLHDAGRRLAELA